MCVGVGIGVDVGIGVLVGFGVGVGSASLQARARMLNRTIIIVDFTVALIRKSESTAKRPPISASLQSRLRGREAEDFVVPAHVEGIRRAVQFVRITQASSHPNQIQTCRSSTTATGPIRQKNNDALPSCTSNRPAHGAGFLGGKVRSMSPAKRRELVDRQHQTLSIVRQCALLGVIAPASTTVPRRPRSRACRVAAV